MKEQSEPIKILLVDDHKIVIDGIKALLKNEKNFKIVGEMLNGQGALTFLKENQVDIVITDITMPEMSGIELTKRIKKEYPSIKVLVLTMQNEASFIKDIFEAEASGYIFKNIDEKELIEAIYKVASGKTYYSDEVLHSVMSVINTKEKKKDGVASLSARELEILNLIAKGYSNLKIAQTLFISEQTVETHRKNIFRRTNTKGVVDLLNYAYKHKLIS